MSSLMTWKQWLEQAVFRLHRSFSSSAKCDAEVLLSFVTKAKRAHLLTFEDTVLTKKQYKDLETLITRREHGEPVAYLTKTREFWSLPLQISINTFIPRPDTECLVERALELLPYSYHEILDLGTGSGAIALALASERPMWRITATDISSAAITIARSNAYFLQITNVQFQQSNWFAKLKKKRYDLIVSNPPYIGEEDLHLMRGDVLFEPLLSLISEENGLKDLSIICNQASQYLLPNGWLLLEHGWKQGMAVRSLLRDAGFKEVITTYDYGGNERVSQGKLC